MCPHDTAYDPTAHPRAGRLGENPALLARADRVDGDGGAGAGSFVAAAPWLSATGEPAGLGVCVETGAEVEEALLAEDAVPAEAPAVASLLQAGRPGTRHPGPGPVNPHGA